MWEEKREGIEPVYGSDFITPFTNRFCPQD